MNTPASTANFLAELCPAKVFTTVIHALKGYVTEVSIEFSLEGLRIQQMDCAHVSLVSVFISRDQFKVYHCDNTINVGFMVDTAAKQLAKNHPSESIVMTVESDTFELEFDEEKCSIPRVISEIENLGIPLQEYEAEITLSSTAFEKVISSLASISDVVGMEITPTSLTLSSKDTVGPLSANYVWQTPAAGKTVAGPGRKKKTNEFQIEKITRDEPLKLSFATKYVKSVAKAKFLNSEVYIKVGKDIPLMVEYQLQTLGAHESGSYVRFYLAPKIDY